MSLPDNGRLGGSGAGAAQPTDGRQPGTHTGPGKPKNLTGFRKARATGSLDMDLQMGRMGMSYMHNPAYSSGHEQPTNEHEDDHQIAHSHMDNAKKAKTTDEKRKHVFNALGALNKAKRRGY
jgi:hypothetical protein